MKIAITGVTGFRNRGVEALVQPTVEQLLARYPAAHITIATWSPKYDQTRLSHPRVDFVEDCYLRNGLWAEPETTIPCGPLPLWRRALRKGMRTLNGGKLAQRQNPVPLLMPFGIPDLVVISGGDLISSDYGTASLAHFLKPVEWARQHRVPCALLGQSIGKFKREEDVGLWRQAEPNASLITLREPLSVDYLVNDLGGEPGKLIETADCAFLLKPDENISRQQPGAADAPCVAISVSESISGWTGSDYELHMNAWVKLIRMMIDDWGVSVALIPHVQETFADDRIIGTNIFRRLGCDRRVRVYAEDLSAAEYKGLISKCSMVIAERMHAAIAGFSTGVCTVPVSYSIKAKGITAGVLEASDIDPDELTMPVADLLDTDSAAKKLTGIWTRREFYSNAIAAGAEASKKRALRNFDLVDGILRAP
jgi:colanic acid/amylovoran biosynthesis protein